MSTCRHALSACCVGLSLAFGLVAAADPVTVVSGLTPLSMSGLEVMLPARPGVDYRVSGSWALSADESFDSRDIIDEFGDDGAILAGNWVVTGYFDAGACEAVLSLEPLDSAWTSEADLWGAKWKVRGGVYTFDSAGLGRRPAAILCQSDAEGRSILLYRFLVDQPESLSQADVMAGLKSALVLEQAWHAYRDARTREVKPLRREEVRNRGKVQAQRARTLEVTKLAVDLPDDGYVWLARSSDGADMLDRMAPSLPDLSLEVVVAEGMGCADLFSAMKSNETLALQAQNAPSGWLAGPTLSLDGKPEFTVCHTASYGALLAGVLQDKAEFDFSPLHAILDSLLRAPRG